MATNLENNRQTHSAGGGNVEGDVSWYDFTLKKTTGPAGMFSTERMKSSLSGEILFRSSEIIRFLKTKGNEETSEAALLHGSIVRQA